MPYIKKALRQDIEDQLFEGFPVITTPGELNYLISQIMINYVKDNGLRYETMNAVIGAVESAKAEFRRRLIDPYEDCMIDANSDLDWGDLL